MKITYPYLNPDDICGEEIGRGTVKVCFRHRQYPDRCVKVCSAEHIRQLDREVSYLAYLQTRGIASPFIPTFYGAFQWQDRIGMIQEGIAEKSAGGAYDSVRPLEHCLDTADSDFAAVRNQVHALKKEMLEKNIIVMDLHGSNLLVTKLNGSIGLKVIDGFGTPEAIPFPKYFRLFGRLKLERKWRSFFGRYPVLR